MNPSIGRVVRALLLVGGIALAAASFASTSSISPSSVAFAVPADNRNQNENHNNDLGSDDNNAERQLRGQVLELHDEMSPPEVLIGTTGENVWARLYNDQLHRSGIGLGDYVRLQGEYSDHGIFDAYEVDVQDRCCDNGNDNS